MFQRKPFIHPRFGECTTNHPLSMPIMFRDLARYNGETAHGIMHNFPYQDRMEQLQEQYDEWAAEIHG